MDCIVHSLCFVTDKFLQLGTVETPVSGHPREAEIVSSGQGKKYCVRSKTERKWPRASIGSLVRTDGNAILGPSASLCYFNSTEKRDEKRCEITIKVVSFFF